MRATPLLSMIDCAAPQPLPTRITGSHCLRSKYSRQVADATHTSLVRVLTATIDEVANAGIALIETARIESARRSHDAEQSRAFMARAILCVESRLGRAMSSRLGRAMGRCLGPAQWPRGRERAPRRVPR